MWTRCQLSSGESIDIHPCLLIIMGASGVGKTTLARALNKKLNWPLMEGDHLHSQHNINKMSASIPLTDKDRWPWLDRCHQWLMETAVTHEGKAILTCSALKKIYRNFLIRELPYSHCFIFLDASYSLLKKRLKNRRNHFMPATLLRNQLQILEPPAMDEQYIKVDMAKDLIVVIDSILYQLSSYDFFKR